MPQGIITVSEFAQACRAGKLAPVVMSYASQSELLQALALIGALEPLGATRPGVCDVVQTLHRTFEVPPATRTTNPAGVEPSEELVAELCPGSGIAMVVEFLRLLPANLTAELSGRVRIKVSPLTLFGKNCLPWGMKGDICGAFINIEHLVLCPKTGVEIWAVNCDPCSPALFTVKSRLWETC